MQTQGYIKSVQPLCEYHWDNISLQGMERTFHILRALEFKLNNFPDCSKLFFFFDIKSTFKLQIVLIIISYFPSESCTGL